MSVLTLSHLAEGFYGQSTGLGFRRPALPLITHTALGTSLHLVPSLVGLQTRSGSSYISPPCCKVFASQEISGQDLASCCPDQLCGVPGPWGP